MIFTGLKSPKGEIIPVQAAGMIYNENVNSIALGHGTSAIGKDQFVFGRYNVEDANKAEIVGGGSVTADYSSEFDIVLKDMPGSMRNRVFHLKAIRTNDSFSIKKSGNDVYKVTAIAEQIAAGTYSFVHNGQTVTNTEYFGAGDYIQVDSNALAEGAVVELDHKFAPLPGSGVGDDAWVSPSLVVDEIEATGIARKNIRTLEWDGTQWNAGDITCDDGNGNTISLREVASRTPGEGGEGYDMYLNIYVTLLSNNGDISEGGTVSESAGLEALFTNAGNDKCYIFNLTLYRQGVGTWMLPAMVKVVHSSNERIAYINANGNIIEAHRADSDGAITLSTQNGYTPISAFFEHQNVPEE